MSRIQVTDLTFGYEEHPDLIFDHVTFHLDTDWRIGLIGRNGRGKTTFLKLLMGEYEYGGTIQCGFLMDYFPFTCPPYELDTIDCLYCVEPQLQQWKLEKEMDQLRLDREVLYRPMKTLSNGERTKVLLALLFQRENHFLLIDEPTNHLDHESRIQVAQYLKEKRGFLLVSHDRSFLDVCVDHIISINKTGIQIQKGNYTSWEENKRRRDEFEIREHDRLKKDIKRLMQSSRQAGRWADQVESTKIGNKLAKKQKDLPNRDYIGEKSRRMQQRRKNLEQRQERALEEKRGLLKDLERADELKLMPLTYRKECLMTVRDLTIFYENRAVCEGITFSIENGERLALQGRNGCGKSSVLKAILGQKISYSGEIARASGLIVSYVPQDTSFLKGTLSSFIETRKLEEHLVKTLLRKLDFSREQFEKPMEDYSEGQKKKVLLASSLCERAHLYVWDEPFNYIDIASRIQLETLILQWKPTMIFVEHDETFVERTATRKLQMQKV